VSESELKKEQFGLFLKISDNRIDDREHSLGFQAASCNRTRGGGCQISDPTALHGFLVFFFLKLLFNNAESTLCMHVFPSMMT